MDIINTILRSMKYQCLILRWPLGHGWKFVRDPRVICKLAEAGIKVLPQSQRLRGHLLGVAPKPEASAPPFAAGGGKVVEQMGFEPTTPTLRT